MTSQALSGMNDFIFSQILGESVDWIKYLAKNPARESEITVYLATGRYVLAAIDT
jgi:hypothetical protein